MFTIKTISRHGNEALYAGLAVSYFSGTDDNGNSDSDMRPSVCATLDDNSTVHLYHGDVFIMNDNGSTVATYRLPDNVGA